MAWCISGTSPSDYWSRAITESTPSSGSQWDCLFRFKRDYIHHWATLQVIIVKVRTGREKQRVCYRCTMLLTSPEDDYAFDADELGDTREEAREAAACYLLDSFEFDPIAENNTGKWAAFHKLPTYPDPDVSPPPYLATLHVPKLDQELE